MTAQEELNELGDRLAKNHAKLNGQINTKIMKQNEKLKEALGLALQYVPAESNDKNIQDEIEKINLLIKQAT